MKVIKCLLISLGSLSLALGVIGVFLPVLPTTPFLLLTAACYIRGSTRLYHWLIYHKRLGKYICNFREQKGIPFKAKVFSIVTLWLGIGSSIFFFIPWPLAKIFLLIVAICVTIYLLSLKTTN